MWGATWAGTNSLLMRASMHDAHDGRVFAINPKTGKIRAFASYDILLPFQNESAKMSLDYSPDKRALKWH